MYKTNVEIFKELRNELEKLSSDKKKYCKGIGDFTRAKKNIGYNQQYTRAKQTFVSFVYYRWYPMTLFFCRSCVLSIVSNDLLFEGSCHNGYGSREIVIMPMARGKLS